MKHFSAVMRREWAARLSSLIFWVCLVHRIHISLSLCCMHHPACWSALHLSTPHLPRPIYFSQLRASPLAPLFFFFSFLFAQRALTVWSMSKKPFQIFREQPIRKSCLKKGRSFFQRSFWKQQKPSVVLVFRFWTFNIQNQNTFIIPQEMM